MANTDGFANTEATGGGEVGEGRSCSKRRGHFPSDCAISVLKSIICIGLGVLELWWCSLWLRRLVPPSVVLSAKTPALSGFAGKRSEVREYSDPFEVVEVLPLCADSKCDKESISEEAGGCFSASALGLLLVCCCRAS